MNNQNIKKYQQKELNLMRINCKKQEIIFSLCRVTNGEKLEYAQTS